MSDEDKKVSTFKKRHLGFPIGDPFYNHRKATEGGPLQLDIWNGRLGFEFSRYDPNKTGAESRTAEKFTVSNEIAIIIYSVLQNIVRSRHEAWLKGSAYPAFEIPIENVFIDKEGIVHSIGTFYFRSVAIEEDHGVINRVQFAYKNENHDFKTTFGSVLMPVVVSKLDNAIERVDPYDVPLYRFLNILKEFHTSGVILYGGLDKLAELITGWNRGGNNDDSDGDSRSSGGGASNRFTPRREFRTTVKSGDSDIPF